MKIEELTTEYLRKFNGGTAAWVNRLRGTHVEFKIIRMRMASYRRGKVVLIRTNTPGYETIQKITKEEKREKLGFVLEDYVELIENADGSIRLRNYMGGKSIQLKPPQPVDPHRAFRQFERAFPLAGQGRIGYRRL